MYDASLWKTSGHWDKYRENMYTLEVDERDFALKPMNCPAHCLIYAVGAPVLPRPAAAHERGRACATATRCRACCTG